jgi:hypothetical protein
VAENLTIIAGLLALALVIADGLFPRENWPLVNTLRNLLAERSRRRFDAKTWWRR